MSISQEDFRAALGRFGSGVTVITTKDAGGKLHGITVSAFCSVSMSPPLVLICVDKSSGCHSAFSESKLFVVNILEENQQDVSNRFATPSNDKFANTEYSETETGIPILAKALVNLECSLRQCYEAGDHSVFIGEILRIEINDGKPLLYFKGQYRKMTDI